MQVDLGNCEGERCVYVMNYFEWKYYLKLKCYYPFSFREYKHHFKKFQERSEGFY